MKIINPTKYVVRKIHKFDVLNEELNERVCIDVLENIDAPQSPFIAIPFILGYKCDDSIAGIGETIESALGDCLMKISKITWEEFNKKAFPQESYTDGKLPSK